MSADVRSDRGSVTAFVVVLALGLLMVAGMAYDGGSVLRAHASARSFAAKAARAGAQEIDIDLLRSTGRVELDGPAAEAAAHAYLSSVGADGTVAIDGDEVVVTVVVVQPMHILPLPDRRVVATEAASATTGDEQGTEP